MSQDLGFPIPASPVADAETLDFLRIPSLNFDLC